MQYEFLIIDTNKKVTTALITLLTEQNWRYKVIAQSQFERCFSALSENNVVLVEYDFVRRRDFTLLRQVSITPQAAKIVLVGEGGSVMNAVEAMNMGADEYLMLPLTNKQFFGALGKLTNQDEEEAVESTASVQANTTSLPDKSSQEFVAEDIRTKQVVNLAVRLAKTDTTVLITGESGTGKEVLARLIHNQSERSEGPFVAINCAAIPENMLEALLFGYEKGAFTGAYQAHMGKFEQAQGGTLFLDEIGEIDLGLQAKLLRVLQEREIERLCGKKTIPLNIRIIAATNKNLRQAADNKEFREDLLYRISVFPIHIPPLRERRTDVVPIATALLGRHTHSTDQVEFDDDAKMKMLQYHWPGNVRELDNVVQRALILANGLIIGADDIMFGQPFSVSNVSQVIADDSEKPLHKGVRQHEQQLIIETLNAVAGSRKEAAEKLGISPRTLRYKLAKLRDAGIDVPGCA